MFQIRIHGRGGQGVQSLGAVRSTGPVIAATAGPVGKSTTVDVLSADGKRQRVPLEQIPAENRQNRGKKLVVLKEANEIALL